MQQPQARQEEYWVESAHGKRLDEYYWLRDDRRENPEMLAYLEAENAYTDAQLKALQPLQELIYQERLARIKEDDSALPYRLHGFWYYSRMVQGQNYPIYARRKAEENDDVLRIVALNEAADFASEQILLNLNERGAEHEYYSAFPVAIAHEQQLLAWAEDVNGRRQYRIRFRDLKQNRDVEALLENSNGSAVWAADGETLFYIENDPETLLSKRLKRFHLPTGMLETVYEEQDDSNYLSLGKTRDRAYLLLHSNNTNSSAIYYCDAKRLGDWTLFQARQEKVEYSVDHFQNRWYRISNADGAKNFKIDVADDAAGPWSVWLAHRDDALINGLSLFDDFAVVAERSEALERLWLRPHQGEPYYLPVTEALYSIGLSANPEPESAFLRYAYSSMTQPTQVYEYDTRTGEKRLLKTQVVKHYQADLYRSERLWVTARDGVRIPVSLLYHKDTPRDGSAPALLYAYGSYGHSLDPDFSSSVVSFLDRGMVYAVVHVRGGMEMGYDWYEYGRMFHKKNTFNDFMDATQALIEQQYIDPQRIAAMGGSAGGLLMGVLANEAPQMYRAIVSHVPFVDVVTTMLDPSIPLTTNEYEEWGNPEVNADSYAYMLSYSPYDNIRAQAYPAMLITTGLWDSQVQYWEPAKYTARLRRNNTGKLPILLRTNMSAGHGGKSGRYEALREGAEVAAFLLQQLHVDGVCGEEGCPY